MPRIEYTQPMTEFFGSNCNLKKPLTYDQILNIWSNDRGFFEPRHLKEDRQLPDYLFGCACISCYPCKLAERHCVAACQPSGLVEKVAHVATACLEAIPLVGSCVASCDRRLNARNAYEEASSYLNVSTLPEFPETILDRFEKRGPRDYWNISTEYWIYLKGIRDRMTAPIMKGKDEKGQSVIMIRRPHIACTSFLMGITSAEEGFSLDLFYEDGLSVFVGPRRSAQVYETSSADIRYVPAKESIFAISNGLKDFLEHHQNENIAQQVIPDAADALMEYVGPPRIGMS